MPRATKKLNAFTLSEMLVVLLLTLIVVGLAFSVLELVQKQMWGIQDNYTQKTTENRLQQALWIDFNSHAQIEYSPVTKHLSLTNELTHTSYSFHEEYMVRDKDTFYTPLTLKKLYFQGDEVKGGTVDALELTSSPEKNSKNSFVYKVNTAADFMK